MSRAAYLEFGDGGWEFREVSAGSGVSKAGVVVLLELGTKGKGDVDRACVVTV